MESINNMESEQEGIVANLVTEGGKLFGVDFCVPAGIKLTRENALKIFDEGRKSVLELFDGMSE